MASIMNSQYFKNFGIDIFRAIILLIKTLQLKKDKEHGLMNMR